jgi:ABC-type phosphate/phosphonate transport system substrate-binding protein
MMDRTQRAPLRMTFCALAFSLFAHVSWAAPLKLVIHDDGGNEGQPPPTAGQYGALRKTIETAIGRPVDLVLTRDRQRVADLMERNGADVFITPGSDIAARAVQTLGFNFIAAARPDVTVLFIGKGAPIESLKSLAGQAVSMPAAESLAGQMCLAEMRDFNGKAFTARHSREYGGVAWAVANNVERVGCIASHAKVKESLAASGLKVIYEGRPVPAMPVVSALSLPAADRVAIAKALSNLDDEGPGKAALKPLGVSTFSEGGELRLRALSTWLKSK